MPDVTTSSFVSTPARLRLVAVVVAAAAVLVACGSPAPANPAPTPRAATATPTPHRLTKAQFTARLKAAGWPVGSQAYATAVRACATHTPDADLRHLAEFVDPQASDTKLAAYVDAVRETC